MKADKTLFEMLEAAPADKACFIFDGKITTYGEFRDQVQRVATGLRALGVQRNDIVGLWLPNTLEWMVNAFACARLGAAALSLNLRFSGYEVADFISRAKCKALIYTPTYRGRNFTEELGRMDPQTLASLKAVVSMEAGPAVLEGVAHASYPELLTTTPSDLAEGQADDACIILSSSGTTSKPKLIVHSQGRVVRHSYDVAHTFGIDADDARVLLGVPMFGAFGYTVALGSLAAGATLVVMENFEPAAAADLFNSERITHSFGTNDMMEKVLDAGGADWRPAALRMYGHANFTPGLLHLPERARQHGVFMRGCFGMSETLALFGTQPVDADLERRAQSGGIPIAPGAQVRVRDVDSGELMAPGEVGEIEVLHPDVMLGYLGDEQATRKAFTDDGFLRTGDLGYLNEDGGFTHLSRIGDVLRIGGYLVNPLEIEETVLHGLDLPAHQMPKACQVVEVEAHGSARPVAFVTADEGYVHDEQAIIAACHQKIAKFKVPVRVILVDEFPTTPSPNGAKVLKNELRKMASEAMAAEGNRA